MRRVEPNMEKDPVCGMAVEPKTAAGSLEWEWDGKSYYFCSASCLRRFAEAPETFIDQLHA